MAVSQAVVPTSVPIPITSRGVAKARTVIPDATRKLFDDWFEGLFIQEPDLNSILTNQGRGFPGNAVGAPNPSFDGGYYNDFNYNRGLYNAPNSGAIEGGNDGANRNVPRRSTTSRR